MAGDIYIILGFENPYHLAPWSGYLVVVLLLLLILVVVIVIGHVQSHRSPLVSKERSPALTPDTQQIPCYALSVVFDSEKQPELMEMQNIITALFTGL